jgi:glyoxalase family protein
LITVFTSEGWRKDTSPTPLKAGSLHHLAFIVSRATYTQAAARLKARGFASSGEIDRGFMDSLYFREPLGHILELACYKFDPPVGYTHTDVLARAHKIRVAVGAKNIADPHLADAITELSAGSRR